ncbi:RHS repeat-associated core domain-containing protein [Apibacter sp. HY039]|uniref:RHS repeat-associated core domain-containing protein n=1 Tax=Apibacter sp. HY039 TaxID=2501476 RepID=UPI002105A58D|nr:RHS repeat-associated core domain-containing protein [Apibacter sp. HY039]
MDEETGLYYYGARYYNPRESIFLSVDPMAEKYSSVSPYAYTFNNPVKYIDPTGMMPENGAGDPPGNVHFLIHTGGAGDFVDALKTRAKEIKKNNPKDKVVELTVKDLGKLKEVVESEVQKARKEGYGMTVEASFFWHGGTDGPVGELVTLGQYNLRLETGVFDDRGQLSPEGWGLIDWNFDPNGSIAVFYGCNTEPFASNFLNYSNVKYSSGMAGYSGGSYTYKGDFDSSWFGLGNVYMVTQQDGKILPKKVFSQESGIVSIYGNLSVNSKGAVVNDTEQSKRNSAKRRAPSIMRFPAH